MDISDDPDFGAKAPRYCTARASLACQKIREGEYVNVKFSHTSDTGTHWFLITRNERGVVEPPVAYPHHHLEDFAL